MIGWNQAVFFLIGAVAFGIIISPAVRERLMNFADRYPYILLIITIALIGGTFFFGTALSGGRKLWYRVGPLTIQPIEISKILFVYVVAAFLEKKAYTFQKSRRLSSLISLGVMCLSLFLVLLLQKDLGPIMVLVIVCLWMFVSVSGRIDLLATALLAIGTVIGLAFWFKQPSMVYHRIMDFVDPLQYSSQMTYALWTQASGDLWGTALGMSRAYKVPVIESDYIFTAILAEKGWIGAAVVLTVFWAFSIRGIQLARFLVKGHSRDATFMMGVVMVLFVQQVVIVAGNLNMLPLSGLTLPFVSAGGSSLVVNLGVLALMLGLVARHTRPAQITETGQVKSIPMPIAAANPTRVEPEFEPSVRDDEMVLGGRAFRAGSAVKPGGHA
nr:FtsW/RodA/SpoVE family cell cycle protein [Acanthopleuribacter pedis]